MTRDRWRRLILQVGAESVTCYGHEPLASSLGPGIIARDYDPLGPSKLTQPPPAALVAVFRYLETLDPSQVLGELCRINDLSRGLVLIHVHLNRPASWWLTQFHDAGLRQLRFVEYANELVYRGSPRPRLRSVA